MREQILAEIKRIAAANGGQPPGRLVFEKETGIRITSWRGKYWARWGDAVAEAGFTAQEYKQKWDADFIFPMIAHAFRHYKLIPTSAEFEMYRQVKQDFPWYSSLGNHFGSKAVLVDAFRKWASANEGYEDIVAMIPDTRLAMKSPAAKDGHVYLIKSGAFYKIGRGEELEKRVKQIRTALPDTSDFVHSIRTDDPAGIEAYWHRRFDDKRANGEWFKLSLQDVAAFKRRKYQ